MKPTATARPWKTGSGLVAIYISSPDGYVRIATPFRESVWDNDDEAMANARLIVRAVNVEPKMRELVALALEDENERRKGDWWGDLQRLARTIKAELEEATDEK